VRRQCHPFAPRQRILAHVLILIAASGYRRWLSRPWQVTLGHFMVVVAGCASGLVLAGLPRPLAAFLFALALAVFISLRLRWHGFRLADILMLLAILLATIAVLLPEMEATRERTAGRRYYPFAVPQRYVELLYGRD
jgi:hypothetical protein